MHKEILSEDATPAIPPRGENQQVVDNTPWWSVFFDAMDTDATTLVQLLRGLPLSRLRTDLEKVARQQAELDTQRALLELAIRWRELDNGNGTPEGNGQSHRLVGEKPSLRNALRLVMSEGPVDWTGPDLERELDKRGWLPGSKTPRTQITNRLAEMVDRGEVAKRERGVYYLVARESAQGNVLGARERAE